MGALAPDLAPPGAGGGGTQDGTFFGQGQAAGGVLGGAEFAVDFVLVGGGQQLVEQVSEASWFWRARQRRLARSIWKPRLRSSSLVPGAAGRCQLPGEKLGEQGGAGAVFVLVVSYCWAGPVVDWGSPRAFFH